MSRPIHLVSSFFTVGGWTLISRVMGLIRDLFMAAFLGTGAVAEAFQIAFALPNMFRRFFAEGAFNMAFVPMFSKKFQANDDALGFAKDAFTGLASILIVLTLLAQLAMPWLVLAMASGFKGDERFDLAVGYGRIVFPYILFISLAALLSGVLNALGRFAAAAAAPVVLNVILISVMVGANALHLDLGNALVWGVAAAGIAQFALLWLAAAQAGFRLTFRLPKMTPELKQLAIIAAPAALAGGVVQVNLLVGRQVASFFDGAVAWLYYADRLYQLPLGVVGIAIGVVLLPDLSRKLQAGDTAGSQNAVNRAAEFSLALTLPAAVALMVIPLPLISVLFERGAFTVEDSLMTAAAVAIYGAGLPAFVLQKVLQPLYFARADTKRPFYFALVSMVVNAGLAIGLMATVGFLAAAIAATVAAWAMVFLLWRNSRAMGAAAATDDRLKRVAPKMFLASAVMGVALYFTAVTLMPVLEMPGWRYLGLGVLIAFGMGVYGVAGVVFGAFRPSELQASLRRGP